MTKVSLKTTYPSKDRLSALAVLLFGGDKVPADINEMCGGAAGRAARLGDFKGETGQTVALYASGRTERVVLVGLGSRKTFILNGATVALSPSERVTVDS